MKIVLKALVAVVAAGIVFAWMNFIVGAKIVEGSIGAAAVLLLVGALMFLDRIAATLSRDKIAFAGIGILGGLAAAYFLAGLLTGDMQLYLPAFAVVLVVAGCIAGLSYAAAPRAAGGGGGASFAGEAPAVGGIKDKILDTSIVIDGRILDIATTNFIEGAMIIPNFVLREIQLISDSPDPVKRNRGRRGLEMLNKLQQLDNVKVKISYVDFADARDVDAKLVRMARETGGKLITNDFNLNKVAELQGVEVLNLNTLTSALKPVVLPGEEIIIDVIKEGKDENQGIGYLEDGTMVVVENGRALLGKTVKVVVTSIIQTAAGKMIFTRATGAVESEDDGGKRGGGNQNGGGRGGRDQGGGYRDRDDREFSRGGRRR
jgi:uncharacterized protein YacL